MRATLPAVSDLKEWYRLHQREILEDYFTFLKFPSLSTDPAYKLSVRETALWLKEFLQKCGLCAELWETTGHPVVFASLLHAGPDRPTLLFYAHYDVQPVDPIGEWHSDPFDPVLKEGKVYARGASDNKGQCFYTLCAIRAYLELMKESAVNIKVFIEGEEEIGSLGTAGILASKEKELKSDYLFLLDFGISNADSPAVMMGMRGLLSLEVTVQNSAIDLHSGVHGGMALNPNHALLSALSKMWTESGRIAIPGFFDDVALPAQEELDRYDLSFDPVSYKNKFGIKACIPTPGASLLESNWFYPSLDVNGMYGGYCGEGFKTVIPAKARAKISCRLVPHQDPHKIAEALTAFLKNHLSENLHVEIKILQQHASYRAAWDTNVVKISKEAYEEVFSKECRYLLCGATVPLVPKLAFYSGGEAALIGVALDSDDMHAPNEHFDLERFEKGFLVIGRILISCSSFS